MNFYEFSKNDPRTLQTPAGDYAWRYEDIPYALSYVEKMGGTILGADTWTENWDFFFTDWYYDPPRCTDLNIPRAAEAVSAESIRVFQETLQDFCERYGSNFYFVITVMSRGRLLIDLADSL